MDNAELRNIIIQSLKKENFEMASVDVDGNYFAAADIALKNSGGSCEVFRIAVVKQDQKKSFS